MNDGGDFSNSCCLHSELPLQEEDKILSCAANTHMYPEDGRVVNVGHFLQHFLALMQGCKLGDKQRNAQTGLREVWRGHEGEMWRR